jgi:hypothetical protein
MHFYKKSSHLALIQLFPSEQGCRDKKIAKLKSRDVWGWCFVLCGRRDSNPHAVKRQILSLVRLPITPLPQLGCHCFGLQR